MANKLLPCFYLIINASSYSFPFWMDWDNLCHFGRNILLCHFGCFLWLLDEFCAFWMNWAYTFLQKKTCRIEFKQMLSCSRCCTLYTKHLRSTSNAHFSPGIFKQSLHSLIWLLCNHNLHCIFTQICLHRPAWKLQNRQDAVAGRRQEAFWQCK